MNQAQKKTPLAGSPFDTSMRVEGTNVKQFFNNLTASFAYNMRPRQACACGGVLGTVCTDDGGGENECFSKCNSCGKETW